MWLMKANGCCERCRDPRLFSLHRSSLPSLTSPASPAAITLRARLVHKRPHPAALSFNDRLRPPHHDPSLSLLLHPHLGLGRISAMSFLDTIQNAAMKVLPEKKSSLPMHSSNAGIASGGHVPFEDDVSLPFPHLPFISPTRGPRPLASFLPRATCLVGAIVPVFIPCPPVARSPSLCRP